MAQPTSKVETREEVFDDATGTSYLSINGAKLGAVDGTTAYVAKLTDGSEKVICVPFGYVEGTASDVAITDVTTAAGPPKVPTPRIDFIKFRVCAEAMLTNRSSFNFRGYTVEVDALNDGVEMGDFVTMRIVDARESESELLPPLFGPP